MRRVKRRPAGAAVKRNATKTAGHNTKGRSGHENRTPVIPVRWGWSCDSKPTIHLLLPEGRLEPVYTTRALLRRMKQGVWAMVLEDRRITGIENRGGDADRRVYKARFVRHLNEQETERALTAAPLLH